MPSTESVGWFGWLREPRRPGWPMVLRQCLTTLIFLAPRIRSRLLISLVTAATISPVSALLTRRISSLPVVSARIHSRKSPTFQCLISA
ncbi:Uncharacterised protein [Mycobacteroides abscessus subsp. abscessus]|nr:Uncharacterised protein [Mycobacteroides abscessus subsp. abscessus]